MFEVDTVNNSIVETMIVDTIRTIDTMIAILNVTTVIVTMVIVTIVIITVIPILDVTEASTENVNMRDMIMAMVGGADLLLPHETIIGTGKKNTVGN